MEKQIQQRQIAYKCTVADILNSQFIKEEGWNPSYLSVADKNIARLNIIGAIIEKEDNEQNTRMALDDGTGNINIVSFEKIYGIDNINIGDVVLIIGKPREYNNEKYIMPETMKKVDKLWLEVRKKEISPKVTKKESEPKVEDVEDDTSPAEVILITINQLDKGDGVSYDELCEKIKLPNTDETINSLLERGEIFEVSPGKYKVLD